MTTCVAVSGAHYPKAVNGLAILPMEGRSLVPAFNDQPVDRDFMAWEHEGNKAIRAGDWKLVAIAGQPWELFNMTQDRTELHNLADKEPDRVKDLSAKWQAWAKRCHVLRDEKGGN